MRASCGHVGAPIVIGASGMACCSRCDAPLTATTVSRLSQHDGERPCKGKAKYLRVWKIARAAGDSEAWAEGRDRVMTAACWARWARTAARAPKVVKLEPKKETTARDRVLAELGAVKRTG